MKKFFNKIALVIALVATGLSTTSCGVDINQLWSFAELLTQVNGGSETTFVGTAQFQRDYIKDGKWLYNPGTGQATNSNYTAVIKVEGKSAIQQILGSLAQGGVTQKSVSISLGNITVEGVTLSNVVLSSVSYNNGMIGDVNDEGYAYSVSYTMNGKTYTTPADFSATPYAFVAGELQSSEDGESGELTLSIQIMHDEETQFEVEYKGYSK